MRLPQLQSRAAQFRRAAKQRLKHLAHRPKRTPTVLQMEATECGAACLGMVLAYHGRWVPLEELRIACGVSRDGSKASNILKAARGLGLTAKGFRKEPTQLIDLPLPAIIHWNFNHYVVFEGVKGGSGYLNDPATGPRRVALVELHESFTGVALAFEPSDRFQRGGLRTGRLGELGSHLGNALGGLAFVATVSLLLVIPGILIPVFAKVFVDDILVDQLSDWLRPLLLGMLLTASLRGVLTWLQQRYLLKLETKLAVTMASRYLTRLMGLPLAFYGQRHVGDLAARVAAGDRVAQLLSGQLASNLFNLIAVVFYGLLMLAYDMLLGAIGVLVTLLNLLVLKIVGRKRTDLSRKLLNDQGKLAATTAESIRAIETIKSGSFEQDFFSRWAGYQANALVGQQALGQYATLLVLFPALLTALGTTAILGIGAYRIISGDLTIGTLVAFQSLAASFNAPITALVNLGGQLQTIQGDLNRLADVMRFPTQRDPLAWADTDGWPAKLDGRLEVSHVSYGYSPLEPPLIRDFSLILEPGRRVALVGSSGSGKSTLGRLICGLYIPWSGEVRIDGHRLEDVPPGILANSVAYVDQEIFLFQGSVRDNLTLWDGTVPEASMTLALKDAAIHAEVMGRPGGYDHQLIEGGFNFSGGQRQRLEIARALVNEPTLLVLDEATAALDPLTEKSIDDNLRRRGIACVIIAHRLSTIRDCDEIIVLRHGEVVERGSHETLMARNGEYAALVATM